MKNYTKTHTVKIRIYTLLLLLLSLFFTCGGWFFTKQLLKYKETQLLSKSGQLQVADSGHSLLQINEQESNTDDETNLSDIFHGKSISEDQMAQILSCWESGTSLISHDPQKGQINMEQAINTGIDWINDLSQKGFLSSDLSENNFQNINAILYTPEERQNIPDHLLSFWKISYTLKDSCISLIIHAAAGQVWQADLSAPSDALPVPDHAAEEKLLKTAFPFFTDGGTEISQNIENEDYKLRIISAERKISAQMRRGLISENNEKYFTMITLSLSSNTAKNQTKS